MNRLDAHSFSDVLFLVCLVALLALPIGCTKRTASRDDSGVPEVKEVSPALEDTTAAAPEPSSSSASVASESPADGSDVGELKIRFQYGGDVPQPTKVLVDRDIEFCGKIPLIDEKLLVSKENKGIKNVIVYLYPPRGTEAPESDAVEQTLTLKNENCRFEPHILVMKKGDTLRVTNEDDVGHNTNVSFFNNSPQNATIPQGADKLFSLAKSEPAPIPVECNIHPWMKSFLVVLDHSFVAVSDENGELTISGLPVGEKLVFRVFHEAGSINQVTVEGKETEWRRSRFEVDVQPGVNDLGTVVIPAESLSAE